MCLCQAREWAEAEGKERGVLTKVPSLSLISAGGAETIRGTGEKRQGERRGNAPLRRCHGCERGISLSDELMKHMLRWIMESSRGWATVFVHYSPTWCLWRDVSWQREGPPLKGISLFTQQGRTTRIKAMRRQIEHKTNHKTARQPASRFYRTHISLSLCRALEACSWNYITLYIKCWE